MPSQEEDQKGEESQRSLGTQEASLRVSSVLPLHEGRGELFHNSCVGFNLLNNQVMVSKPEMSYREVMTEMGRVWNHELDEEQKAPFQAQHQQLTVEWKRAMDAYKLGEVKKGPAEVVKGCAIEKKGDINSNQEAKGVESEHGEESNVEDDKRDEARIDGRFIKILFLQFVP